MTAELEKRYKKKLEIIRENMVEYNKIALLTETDYRTMINAILSLMEENEELKCQIKRLENIVDQFDPAPQFKTEKKTPKFDTTEKVDHSNTRFFI